MHVLPLAKRAEVVEHLMEGNGMRPTARLCGVNRNTISTLLLDVARGAAWLHNRLVRNLDVVHVEADELHSFVGVRQKNLRPEHPSEYGEQWIWLAFARASKLVISYRVGKREEENAVALMADLRARLVSIPVLCSDALPAYLAAVGQAFFDPELPGGVDYCQVVKAFNGRGRETKRAPGAPSVTKRVICGAPDLSESGTSYVERENLTFRTQLRRLVRRGSGHSKSLAHHEAAIAAFVTWSNFCRPHSTLKGKSPAQAAGIADHRWTTAEFVEACFAAEPCDPPEPGPLAPRAAPQVPQRVTTTGRVLQLVRQAGSKPAAAPASPVERPAMGPRGKQLDLFADVTTTPAKSPKPLPPKGTQLSLVFEYDRIDPQ